ncbi:putative cation transporter HKT6 [Sesamum angolense]|uniref:Cation transporter HKT6 n=1 Tax=Sesamum angolense TaxID=2727404 RepID=A0AAE2BNH9_9LAMI|nr:putative cation transporter HKT6 [Sesamum angolense]
MNKFACYGKKLQHLCSCSWQLTRFFIYCCYHDLLFRVNPFLTYILYFISLSLVGFGVLKALKPRTLSTPRNIDLFFTSVSAATVSSMSTVEMEVFSNAQLVVMTVLMFVGGEVFTSMVGLHLKRSKIIRTWKSEVKVESVESDPRSPPPVDPSDQIELNIVTVPERGLAQFESQHDVFSSYNPFLKYDSIKFLGFLVLGYLVVIHILGVTSVLIYLALVSSANNVLRNKGIKTFTFAIFTIVSTFASCGFVPTNENMIVFGKNSGLLWILIPQVLVGNTLFPSCLRFLIWVVGKKIKKVEANYLLNHTTEAGYMHLLPSLHSVLLVATVFGFILIGFIIFCSLEWNSAALSGLNTYQKVVGILFQCVNARHSGETIVDLSTIAPAILVFFVVMMYLPPYTSFLPIKRDEQSQLESEGKEKRREKFADNLIFSQLSYLVIFIILICITERKSMKEDPINFSVLNIIVEVISAYGNVGFTTGYSCERQLRPDPNCVNKWYGFSGKWSDEGKLSLIIVMFFGRLKKFNMNGGLAWKLL